MPEADDVKYVAYCGLCCRDCPFHKGDVADLARDLRKALRANKFDKVAAGLPFKEFKKYGDCYEVLGAMVKLRCPRGCRDGGGPPRCRIRDCCGKRALAGCWECDQYAACGKLRKQLAPGHGKAYLYNIRKIKKSGLDAFLAWPRKWWAG